VTVEAEACCHGDRREAEVRDDADDGEQREGQQQDEAAGKHCARLLHVTPQNQLFHCNVSANPNINPRSVLEMGKMGKDPIFLVCVRLRFFFDNGSVLSGLGSVIIFFTTRKF